MCLLSLDLSRIIFVLWWFHVRLFWNQLRTKPTVCSDFSSSLWCFLKTVLSSVEFCNFLFSVPFVVLPFLYYIDIFSRVVFFALRSIFFFYNSFSLHVLLSTLREKLCVLYFSSWHNIAIYRVYGTFFIIVFIQFSHFLVRSVFMVFFSIELWARLFWIFVSVFCGVEYALTRSRRTVIVLFSV